MKIFKVISWIMAYLFYAFVTFLFIWMLFFICMGISVSEDRIQKDIEDSLMVFMAKKSLIVIISACVFAISDAFLFHLFRRIIAHNRSLSALVVRHLLFFGAFSLLYLTYYFYSTLAK